MTGRLARICRHPIKAHGREDLAAVDLVAGAGMPWDRHWAVAHDAARLVPGWNDCVNFARGSKAPMLMAISAELDEAAATVTLRHPDRADLTFAPDDPGDLSRFLEWVRPLNPPDRAQPARIVTEGVAMTDSEYPTVSILNLTSGVALGHALGVDLSPHRWRANLWVDGLEPWVERDWIGHRLTVGDTVLEVTEHIVRCRATMANPATGLIDADTLTALKTTQGNQEMGLYAVVVTGGRIAQGDRIAVA